MTLLKLSVEFAAGVTQSEKRGVAFLRIDPPSADPTLNAGSLFDTSANVALGKRIRHRMGLWIQSPLDRPGKFHGFTKYEKKYRDCFTFIDIEEKIRYYGFRCHPKPDDPRYELVVLISCVDKKEDAVNKAELDRVLMWKHNMATQQALTKKFPKKESGGKK
jgi:hypothetical protein